MAKIHLLPTIVLVCFTLVMSDESLQAERIATKDHKILDSSGEDSGKKLNCPSGKKELCLILALSRIAKVQVANPTRETESRNSRARTIETHRTINYFNSTGKKSFNRDEKYPAHLQSSTESSYRNNVHCRAIRDIYIPEVHQKLPAFACKQGNRTFVLSSERFLEDRRAYLDIVVDENSFGNLKFSSKHSGSTDFNLIPALLVLRAGESNYKIQPREDIVK